MTSDPGLGAVVPFRFECQRSGRCCSADAGIVWVEQDELAGLAAALGMTLEAFSRTHLRTVVAPKGPDPKGPDPKGAGRRVLLRQRGASGDSDGACTLLEGSSECRVYDARPAHCRQYPHWPSILEDREAFAAARATCPGIMPLASESQRSAAFGELERLYAELDRAVVELQPICVRSGLCCRFEEVGHELFATALECDYALHRHPRAPAPEAPGRCPYHVGGVCTARDGRPLGCRTYFCDARTETRLRALHELFLGRIRGIEREYEYPAAYDRFPAMLAQRGLGKDVMQDSEDEDEVRETGRDGQP